MDAINIKGRITIVNDVESFPSGFEKKSIIVDTEKEGSDYPNPCKIEFHKTEKIALTDALTVGMEVDIACNLRGNEHNGNHYLGLVAWKINEAKGSGAF